jgi:drug/metabolite transporter (DMT)-like permease
MNIFIIILIIISVSISSVAQIILKKGMSSPDVINAISSNSGFMVIRAISTNYWVLVGLSLYFFSALVWLFVLSKTEVSLAYPFVGLGFVFTMLLGCFLLGESVSIAKIAGTVLIAAGVFSLTRG